MSSSMPTASGAVAPSAVREHFGDLGVPSEIVSSLAARGITAAFPIQTATLPDALAGRDVCGRAPTGSGKTIAFGIPLVLAATGSRPRRPRGLVLVPTRELAAQVADELVHLAGPSGARIGTFYGGVGLAQQRTALRRGVDVAVACPGRLADLISQGDVHLDHVRLAVVDEADRMADMGFLPEVRRLLDRCPTDRQTLLFSATLDGDVDVLTTRYQRAPVRHELADEDHDGLVEHRWWKVERPERIATTVRLVRRVGPTIVFCRTRHGADRVARQLGTAGVEAVTIHGGRSQAQRDRALRAFHRGEVAALVATDVAARGIHVAGVRCVVHFDPAADDKDYVHRSGRTGRAGSTGVVVTLVGREVRPAVSSLQRALGCPVGVEAADVDSLDPGGVAPAPASPRRSSSRRPRKAPGASPEQSKGRASGSRRRSPSPAGNRRRSRPRRARSSR